jgi:Susd and RagB outer membrane lipoprotein
MKIIKFKKQYLQSRIVVMLLLAIVLLYLPSCTKKFDEINTDPTRLTSLTQEDAKGLFSSAEYAGLYGGWNYQTAQGLFADQYCQYFAGTQTAFASHRYTIVQKWVKDQFVATYSGTMPALFAIIKNTDATNTPTLNAIARIWKVFVLHRTTDYYGPIPYSKIGSPESTVAYDAQKDIYFDFFKELKESADLLKANLAKPSFGASDKIYGGDNAAWLKFCNSLRLRLALRISKVEPAKAKAEAEAAYADGLMLTPADDAKYNVTSDNFNPFGVQSGWNEFRMSATMESVLKGYSDPRMQKYFQPAVSDGQYHGARNGMVPAEQSIAANDYDHNSNVAPLLTPTEKGNTTYSVIRAAESYFLRAEGALNGWNMGGTAKELYEKGIDASMRSWNITNTAAITSYTNGTTPPVALTDYFNTPALTDIPVKWAATADKQLEQILTQKWLALFPDGHEAWAEMRRAKFPKFYPLIHSDNADVPANKMISRIPFLDYDRDRNGPAVEAAKSLLGGSDKASTALWWDK